MIGKLTCYNSDQFGTYEETVIKAYANEMHNILSMCQRTGQGEKTTSLIIDIADMLLNDLEHTTIGRIIDEIVKKLPIQFHLYIFSIEYNLRCLILPLYLP